MCISIYLILILTFWNREVIYWQVDRSFLHFGDEARREQEKEMFEFKMTDTFYLCWATLLLFPLDDVYLDDK
jgi:hypothetical protein